MAKKVNLRFCGVKRILQSRPSFDRSNPKFIATCKKSSAEVEKIS